MKRVKTNIRGFDDLIQGGLPSKSAILLTGSPGTCKTIFGLEFAYHRASRGDSCLFVALEQEPEQLRSQAKQFGLDFKPLEKKKAMYFMRLRPSDLEESSVQQIIDFIQSNNITRVVIDSLSALAINLPTTFTKATEITSIYTQRVMYKFISSFKQLNATTLLIAQSGKDTLSQDSVCEFICDGIIHITYEPMGGKYSRMLTIRKMRETKHNEDIHPLEIGEQGLIVHSLT